MSPILTSHCGRIAAYASDARDQRRSDGGLADSAFLPSPPQEEVASYACGPSLRSLTPTQVMRFRAYRAMPVRAAACLANGQWLTAAISNGYKRQP